MASVHGTSFDIEFPEDSLFSEGNTKGVLTLNIASGGRIFKLSFWEPGALHRAHERLLPSFDNRLYYVVPFGQLVTKLPFTRDKIQSIIDELEGSGYFDRHSDQAINHPDQ